MHTRKRVAHYGLPLPPGLTADGYAAGNSLPTLSLRFKEPPSTHYACLCPRLFAQQPVLCFLHITTSPGPVRIAFAFRAPSISLSLPFPHSLSPSSCFSLIGSDSVVAGAVILSLPLASLHSRLPKLVERKRNDRCNVFLLQSRRARLPASACRR